MSDIVNLSLSQIIVSLLNVASSLDSLIKQKTEITRTEVEEALNKALQELGMEVSGRKGDFIDEIIASLVNTNRAFQKVYLIPKKS